MSGASSRGVQGAHLRAPAGSRGNNPHFLLRGLAPISRHTALKGALIIIIRNLLAWIWWKNVISPTLITVWFWTGKCCIRSLTPILGRTLQTVEPCVSVWCMIFFFQFQWIFGYGSKEIQHWIHWENLRHIFWLNRKEFNRQSETGYWYSCRDFRKSHRRWCVLWFEGKFRHAKYGSTVFSSSFVL